MVDEILNAIRRIPGTQAAAVTQCTLSPLELARAYLRGADRARYEILHGNDIASCGVGADYFRRETCSSK
jgi:hypothetical protein